MTRPTISKGSKSFEMISKAMIDPRVWGLFYKTPSLPIFHLSRDFLVLSSLLLGFGAELGGG